MVPYFPRIFSRSAVMAYLLLLAVVLVAFRYPMDWYMYVFGLIGTIAFFYCSANITRGWAVYPEKIQEKKIFRTSLAIRVVYVIFSYFFFLSVTGEPFDLNAADSFGYHETAKDLSNNIVSLGGLLTMFSFDDVGYPFFVSLIYRLSGDSILVARLVKALLSAFTVVLIFRYSSRNFGVDTARMAAVFCMLMPNLIWYSGAHNKETEMLFLTVLFIERTDYLLRKSRVGFFDVVAVAASCFFLFFFRQVLAIVLILSLATALLLSSERVVSKAKKVSVGLYLAFAVGLGVLSGSPIFYNSRDYQDASAEQSKNMAWRAERDNGNSLAKYAGAAVFAPLIFTLPFPTMVDIPEQENQQMLHSGTFVKNIMSFFTILAMFLLLLSGKWKEHVLSLSFLIGYLIVLVFSSYAQSERFHIPVLPFILMYAAYGVSQIRKEHVPLFKYWTVLVFFIGIAWQWFKLKGRGML